MAKTNFEDISFFNIPEYLRPISMSFEAIFGTFLYSLEVYEDKGTYDFPYIYDRWMVPFTDIRVQIGICLQRSRTISVLEATWTDTKPERLTVGGFMPIPTDKKHDYKPRFSFGTVGLQEELKIYFQDLRELLLSVKGDIDLDGFSMQVQEFKNEVNNLHLDPEHDLMLLSDVMVEALTFTQES